MVGVIQDLYPSTYNTLKNNYLNIWIPTVLKEGSPQFSSSLLGISSFPSSLSEANYANSVFVESDALETYGAKLLAHELGHYFGLHHIFKGGCNVANDCMHGDYIESIPSCDFISGGITNPLDCDNYKICTSNTDYPVENFMSYAFACMDEFKAEQYDRMSYYIIDWSNLYNITNLTRTLSNPNPSQPLSNNYTFTSGATNVSYDVDAEANIYLDGNITFSGCNFNMLASSKIIVKSGRNVTFSNCEFKTPSCSALMWDGLEVESSGSINLTNGSLIKDAYIGIKLESGTSIDIQSTNIESSYIGIKFNDAPTPPNLPSPTNINIWNFSNVDIIGSSDLKHHISFNIGSKSYAGILATDLYGLNIMATANNKNIISGSKYGVKSVRTSMFLENNTFSNCDFGLHVISDPKAYRFIHLNNNGFNNCLNSAYISTASLNLTNNAFNGINKGLKLDKCFSGSIISNNKTGFSGFPDISLEITNSGYLTIEDNDFTSWVDNILSNNHNLKVKENFFESFTMTSCRRSEFSENDFQKTSDLNGRPVSILGGNNITLDCNYYFGDTYDALLIDNSPDNTLRCNLFEGGPSSLTFQGNNPGTDLEANTITVGDVGLFLQGSDSEFGPQEDKGNIFSGTFADIGARNENPDFAESLVTNDESAQYNPTYEPLDWFRNNSMEKPSECEPVCQGSGPGSNLIPWYGEKYARCLDSLFNGTKYARYSTKAKWNLLFILFRKNYLRDTSIIKYSPCIKSIIDTYKNTTLHKAVNVYDKMMLPLNPDYNGIVTAVEFLKEDIENEEDITAALDEVKEKTIDYLDSVEIIINTFYNELESVVESLGDLSSEEDVVAKVGVIAPLLYKYYNDEEITNNEIEEIIEVAESCARDAGPSKYYAMALLQTLNVPYNITNCVEEEEPRKGQDKEVVNILNKIEFRSARLYDLNGRFVGKITVLDELYKKILSTGLYILTYLTIDNKIESKKIFIP